MNLNFFLVLLGFNTSAAPSVPPLSQDRYKDIELFSRVLQFVEKNYVDAVPHEKLIQGAIKGMLDTLDPHSNFLSGDVYRDMKIDTSGKYGGVGIEVGMKDDILTILVPFEGTPAWRAGIRPGDRIVKINKESTRGLSLSECVSKMRGDLGSTLHLTIYRKNWTQFKDVALKRETIRLKPVKAEMIEEGYGYLQLSTFSESAAKEIEQAIKDLEKKSKLKGLVLDLRQNAGGLLDQAVEVTSLFIDEGVVVSTRGREGGAPPEIRRAKKGRARKNFRVAVLVGPQTASAAEIVAAALQDHKRALILGNVTFGKGSVQSVVDLGNELGLKLTIAKYYTPNGISIQERGVVPDVVLDEYHPQLLAKARIKKADIREKDLKGHLINTQNSLQYSVQDLETKSIDDRAQGSANGMGSEGEPIEVKPRDDEQVLQSIRHLKLFDVFKTFPST